MLINTLSTRATYTKKPPVTSRPTVTRLTHKKKNCEGATNGVKGRSEDAAGKKLEPTASNDILFLFLLLLCLLGAADSPIRPGVGSTAERERRRRGKRGKKKVKVERER